MNNQILDNILSLFRGDQFKAKIDELLFARSENADFHICLIWDKSAEGHKYIAAFTKSNSYLIAMPLSLIELHKNILGLLHQACNEPDAYCAGGGYLKYEKSAFIAYSESQDFGEYDHLKAEQLFNNVDIANIQDAF